MEKEKEIYEIVKVTSYDLGDWEEFKTKFKEDELDEDEIVCLGAVGLLNILAYEEALEVAEKMSDIEIFCEARYFLEYVYGGKLVLFNSKNEFLTEANLLIPSVIYQTSTGKVIQIFK